MKITLNDHKKKNHSIRLLKQHMTITSLQEELKNIRLDKKDLVNY